VRDSSLSNDDATPCSRTYMCGQKLTSLITDLDVRRLGGGNGGCGVLLTHSRLLISLCDV
jgi:hypothetical protein